jgi:ABC-type antimicrobial peptide transport system permease subunit
VHDPHPRYVFIPQQQSADSVVDLTFLVRYLGTLDAITPIVGRTLAAADATLPIVSMTTMMSRLEGVTVIERQITTLLVAFAVTSLVVAALGQYAVAMFNMRRRTRDFGVRIALGASPQRIRRAVILEALWLSTPGLLVGLGLSVAIATAAQEVLFGVTPVDPATYAGVVLLLAVTSLLASYLPAWRAGRVSVVDALRAE